MKAFFDSDVLLDFFLDRQPFSEGSAVLLDRCERGSLTGTTSPLVLSNVYYILRRTTAHDKVMKCIDLLLDILRITAMDRETVIVGLHAGFSDFEDALQYGAAVSDESIRCIVTRNVKDYRKSTIPVHTPNGLIALLDQQV